MWGRKGIACGFLWIRMSLCRAFLITFPPLNTVYYYHHIYLYIKAPDDMTTLKYFKKITQRV